MMEEVSMTMAYDAVDQMSEEDILACLVAETEPTFTVAKKKPKLRGSLLQIMDDEKEEDPLDKYLKENRRLLQASLRLEQENDNLAHRLITSKVALRIALDKTEDKVDKLTEELLLSRHQLKATEEEKRGKEEEAAMLKEVFRRELEKAEQQVKRSSGIIADYKQICSQLTNRLERQQAAHREELESLKSTVRTCSRCQHIAESGEPPAAGQDSPTAAAGPGRDETTTGPREAELQEEEEALRAQIRELEQDLAQTKVQMVEAKCKIQELEHQKGILANDLQEAKNSWFSKAFTSLRTSGGGLHGISVPRDGSPSAGWNLHGSSLSGWSTKKLPWPHRDAQENI